MASAGVCGRAEGWFNSSHIVQTHAQVYSSNRHERPQRLCQESGRNSGHQQLDLISSTPRATFNYAHFWWFTARLISLTSQAFEGARLSPHSGREFRPELISSTILFFQSSFIPVYCSSSSRTTYKRSCPSKLPVFRIRLTRLHLPLRVENGNSLDVFT